MRLGSLGPFYTQKTRKLVPETLEISFNQVSV